MKEGDIPFRKSDNALQAANDREWQVVISPRALRQLEDLPADIAQDIMNKIEWLRANAEAVRHERLSGGPEFSLHCGQYRAPYLLDRRRRRIEILDVDKHDAAYRRLRRRR